MVDFIYHPREQYIGYSNYMYERGVYVELLESTRVSHFLKGPGLKKETQQVGN